MRVWPVQIGASGLIREKNRLGRGSNLGSQGGNLSLWGPERFISVVGIACSPNHCSEEPKKIQFREKSLAKLASAWYLLIKVINRVHTDRF